MMTALISAITEAFTGAASAMVNGFGSLTQIFYVNEELTVIGCVLFLGLAFMFLMMFLRWIFALIRRV